MVVGRDEVLIATGKNSQGELFKEPKQETMILHSYICSAGRTPEGAVQRQPRTHPDASFHIPCGTVNRTKGNILERERSMFSPGLSLVMATSWPCRLHSRAQPVKAVP